MKPAASESALLPVLLTSERVASDVDSGVVAALVMGEAVGPVCDLVPMVSMPDCAERVRPRLCCLPWPTVFQTASTCWSS